MVSLWTNVVFGDSLQVQTTCLFPNIRPMGAMQVCSFCSSSWHKFFLFWISHQSTLMFWDLRAQKQPSQSSQQQKVDQKKSSVPDTFKHLDRTWKPLFRVTFTIHSLSKLCQNCFSFKMSVNSKVYFFSAVHKQCCCHISHCCFALFWTTISFFVFAFWYFCDLHVKQLRVHLITH